MFCAHNHGGSGYLTGCICQTHQPVHLKLMNFFVCVCYHKADNKKDFKA